jgi:glycosyltransferase involved in cell wall biosynthesis
VTPSYNQGHFIEETIRAVLLQNYPNLEYIICDGCSTDQTQEILKKYSPWLSFWQSKKDRGQGHAINLGFSLASGNYFGWINSDDFYLPNCFQNIATHFSRHSLEFVYGDGINLYDRERKISYWQGNLVLDRYLRFGGLIASHAAFWKSAIHQPIWEKMNCNVDGELWIRLLSGKTKSHLRVPLGVFRLQPQAKSAHARHRKLWQEDDENIATVYGLPPQPRSLLAYQFTLTQRIYQSITKPVNCKKVASLLQEWSWTDQYSLVA